MWLRLTVMATMGGGLENMFRKLESAQMRVGRRVLRTSNIVAVRAMNGDLGWRRGER